MTNQNKIILFFFFCIFIVLNKPDDLTTTSILNNITYEQIGPFRRIPILDQIYKTLNKFPSLNKYTLLSVFDDNRTISEKKTAKFKSLYSKNKDLKFGLSYFKANKRFKKNNTNLPIPKNKFELLADLNDWQSFQILIIPFKEDLNNIKIEISKIHSNKFLFESFIGEYVYCSKPAYKSYGRGWYVDPLIPLKHKSGGNYHCFYDKNYKFNAKINENKSIWFNVYIPKETNPGSYTIPIKITCNKQTQCSQLTIKVSKKKLAPIKKFTDLFSFNEEYLVLWNNNNFDLIKKNRSKTYDFLLKYNLNPLSLYSKEPWPPIDDWKYCISNGANIFNLSYLNEKFEEKKIEENIKKIKELNLEKYTVFFAFDEVQENQYRLLQNEIAKFKNIKSKIPIVCTVDHNDSLKDFIDIFVPLLHKKNQEYNNSYKWNYICNISTQHQINFFIDYPLENIVKLASVIKEKKLNGFLYYSINKWGTNISKYNKINSDLEVNYKQLDSFENELKWPYIKWNSFSYKNYNGDGCLLYPGFNGDLWPSVRLIQIREMITVLNN